MRRKILLWSLAGAAVVGLTLVVLAVVALRDEPLKKRLVALLSDRLVADVTLERLTVKIFPHIHIAGSGLVVRSRARPDLPPLISIRSFEVSPGLFAALRKHVDTVLVEGLVVNVPPRGQGVQTKRSFAPSRSYADHLVSHSATLVFVGLRRDRQPLIFPIHSLEIDSLTFDGPMPFRARLTNPLPEGLVEAEGQFGPWEPENPENTALEGRYTFSDADLSTINGIGGVLSSTGKFAGQLSEIQATGVTHTPDFSLDLGGKSVQLDTKFQAAIDGTNGTTVLHRVDATLGRTALVVKGAIVNLPGPRNRTFDFDAEVADGRIEDLLRLASTDEQPPLTGKISLRAKFGLPPGTTRVSRRLNIEGQFGLGGAQFTDPKMQEKLQELSQRSQGKKADDPVAADVTSDFEGSFRLGDGVLRVSQVTFDVPGATVALDGTYGVESGALDFAGTLRMQASVSRAVGGFKSIFLKLVDPLFRKNGAGAVVPIRITGTRDDPHIGLDMGRVLKRK